MVLSPRKRYSGGDPRLRRIPRRAVLVLAISRGMASPMSTITDELKAIPEVQKVYEEGYEI